MCPLKREQARRETQQWVMRRLPTADSIVEIGRKSRSWIKSCWQHLRVDRCCQQQTYGCGCGKCDHPSTDDRWLLITHNVQLHTARWSIEREVAACGSIGVK